MSSNKNNMSTVASTPSYGHIIKIPRKTDARENYRSGIRASAGSIGGVIAAIPSLYASMKALIGLNPIDEANVFSNVSWIMYSLVRYYFGNPFVVHPAAVIAGFPLPSVDELSHAMSNRVLKYRATGGIFLAHQEGGDQTLRIVGKAYGFNRYYMLNMLDFLFLYGSAVKIDYFKNFITGGISASDIVPSIRGVGVTEDPWREFNNDLLGKAQTEQHLTFPVVTRNRIYSNMYIETYEYKETIENGLDCVEYSIFFRKYVPEFRKDFKIVIDPDSQEPWEDKRIWFRDDVDDDLAKNARKVDMVMDIGYSISMALYRFIILGTQGSLNWHENVAMSFGIGLTDVDVGVAILGGAVTVIGSAITLMANSL